MIYTMICSTCGKAFKHGHAKMYCIECENEAHATKLKARIEYIKAHPDMNITQIALALRVSTETIRLAINENSDPSLVARMGKPEPPRPWTTGEIAILRQYAAEGQTLQEAAAALHRSYRATINRARAAGIKFIRGNAGSGR